MNPANRCARRYAFAALAAVSLCVANTDLCAQAVTEKPTEPPKILKPTGDLITAEQLKSRTFADAYSAIEALHSNWLRARNLNPPGGTAVTPGDAARAGGVTGTAVSVAAGQTGLPRDAVGIQVYLDGVRLGGIEFLKQIPIASVYSIRRINGTDAQARFGIGHSDGVLFVSTGPNKASG